MRRMLFKAKRWSDGKWVFGDLLQYQDGSASIHSYLHGCRVSDNVDPSTVCEYTGFYDRKGMEIFENDTVQVLLHGDLIKSHVTFSDGMFKLLGVSLAAWAKDKHNCEVIGSLNDEKEYK